MRWSLTLVQTYYEWLETVNPSVYKKLEVPLMIRNAETGFLENNFDVSLLRLVSLLCQSLSGLASYVF